MVTRISNGGDAVSMQLVPCSLTKATSVEDAEENINHKKDSILTVDGVRTYKRRKNSQSSSEDMLEQHARTYSEPGKQLLNKNQSKEQMGIISDGSNKPNNHANPLAYSEPCQLILNGVIDSENFGMLSKLLSDNFQGVNIQSFSDFSVINSRIRDGVYSNSPQPFFEDIQQLWSTLQRIGGEMVSLAKGLSDMSRKTYHEKVGGSVNGGYVEGKYDEINRVHLGNMEIRGLDTANHYPSVETNRYSKLDQPDEDNCICRLCGGKTKDRICIVCDSCEKMYHIYCVGVSVSEDSPRSWYCMNCSGAGSETPHANCVVCERVNDQCNKTHAGGDKLGAMNHGMLNKVDKKSNGCMRADPVLESSKSTTGPSCQRCRCEFDDNQYRECEHYLCRKKFHLQCLSKIELKRFGQRWYCSSCLCRVCLVDQDDHQILLCDGCDNAYHTYCMEPPLTAIPEEDKWFCRLCRTRLNAVHKAKRAYEDPENHQKKSDAGAVNTAVRSLAMPVGSVDMLLSAAEKLEVDAMTNERRPAF